MVERLGSSSTILSSHERLDRRDGERERPRASQLSQNGVINPCKPREALTNINLLSVVMLVRAEVELNTSPCHVLVVNAADVTDCRDVYD